MVGISGSVQAQAVPVTVAGTVVYVSGGGGTNGGPALDATVYLLTGSVWIQYQVCVSATETDAARAGKLTLSDQNFADISCAKKTNTPYITHTTPQGTFVFQGVSLGPKDALGHAGLLVAVSGVAEGANASGVTLVSDDGTPGVDEIDITIP